MPETTEYRLSSLEKRVDENEEKNTKAHKEFYRLQADTEVLKSKSEDHNERISDLEGENKKAIVFQALTEERYGNLEKIINETNVNVKAVKGDVQEIKEKPAKKWDKLLLVIMTALVSGIITFMVSKILE